MFAGFLHAQLIRLAAFVFLVLAMPFAFPLPAAIAPAVCAAMIAGAASTAAIGRPAALVTLGRW